MKTIGDRINPWIKNETAHWREHARKRGQKDDPALLVDSEDGKGRLNSEAWFSWATLSTLNGLGVCSFGHDG
jgi:hypothetical protein